MDPDTHAHNHTPAVAHNFPAPRHTHADLHTGSDYHAVIHTHPEPEPERVVAPLTEALDALRAVLDVTGPLPHGYALKHAVERVLDAREAAGI